MQRPTPRGVSQQAPVEDLRMAAPTPVGTEYLLRGVLLLLFVGSSPAALA